MGITFVSFLTLFVVSASFRCHFFQVSRRYIMCAGSLAMGIKERAELGDALVVKSFGHGRGSPRVKLFAPANNTSCPICLPSGSTVLFRNLPVAIQEQNGVGAEARAVMTSPEVDFHTSRNDVFDFGNGHTIELSKLPDDTRLDFVPEDVAVLIEEPGELKAVTTKQPATVAAQIETTDPIGTGLRMLASFVLNARQGEGSLIN